MQTFLLILALFSRFGMGRLLCHMSLEKPQGISAVQLISSLYMFRVGEESITTLGKSDISMEHVTIEMLRRA